MKKIFSLLIGLVLISTGAYATEKEEALIEFESGLLMTYTMDIFRNAAITYFSPEGTDCSEIVPFEEQRFEYNEKNCSEILKQTNGLISCEDVRQIAKEIKQMDCHFEKKGDSLTVSFSDIPSDIDVFISEKMMPILTLQSKGAMTYQKGTFTNNFSLYGGK